MADRRTEALAELGMTRRDPAPRGMGTPERVAISASLLWIVAVGGFLLFTSFGGGDDLGPLRFVMILMAVFMPVALIWVAVTALRTGRTIREETARLETAIEALRRAYLDTHAQGGGTGQRSRVEQKLEEIAAAQRQTESAIAMFSSIRAAAGPPVSEDKPALPATERTEGGEEQGLLAFAAAADGGAPPVSVADFIRAMNFPESAEDKDGFQALRRALRDRGTAQLIQAAQDVLTLLSHDGIYMDDLRPDRARPEIWRRFARGERGRGVSGLGGITDRSVLALSSGRMKQDPVFRDSVHHFLRRFDRTFAEFEQTASDADIAALSDTRTARAFMLLGKVAGTFK
jgi:hypothetical protein